jgi:hypothetical protein
VEITSEAVYSINVKYVKYMTCAIGIICYKMCNIRLLLTFYRQFLHVCTKMVTRSTTYCIESANLMQVLFRNRSFLLTHFC